MSGSISLNGRKKVKRGFSVTAPGLEVERMAE
jgi:hypothetical protein